MSHRIDFVRKQMCVAVRNLPHLLCPEDWQDGVPQLAVKHRPTVVKLRRHLHNMTYVSWQTFYDLHNGSI